jgi:hypothetical protein
VDAADDTSDTLMESQSVWRYCLTNTDAPAYVCAASHICGSPAQEPCSPYLKSSQSPELLKHRPIHHSDDSENTPSSSHQCPPHWEHSGTIE